MRSRDEIAAAVLQTGRKHSFTAEHFDVDCVRPSVRATHQKDLFQAAAAAAAGAVMPC
jgi:hypothetical protein